MVGGTGRFLAGICLAAGLVLAAHEVRGEAPPLRSIEPESYSDQPAGIRFGALLYHASLRSGMAWDSNIFSTKAHVVADRIVILRPGLTVSTVDPNYKFTFRANIQQLEYEVSPSDNRLDGFVDLQGSIRVQKDTTLDVGLVAARIADPRSSIVRRDLPLNAAEPVVHNQYSAWVALRRNFNPLVSTTTLTVLNDDYYDVQSIGGTPLNLQYLDRDVARLTQETDLRISHRLLLFSRERVSMNTYRNVQGFIQDDSVKFDTVNGIEVVITPLITGRFSFQFGEEHFWANTIQSDPERIYRAELLWSPARNIRLKAGFARDFGGVSLTLDAVGGRRTGADFVLEYDITRQLFFRASFLHLHVNESSLSFGNERLENTYFYKASLGYEITRYWVWYLDYAYEKRDANIEANEFDRQIIQSGLIARF
jgi:hypothetical protein